ncbi:MAG TPA: YqgE/AlgH family protein [Methylomirabilota bacterium]|nr:YqgE/AlgH family protein [Methylomirabilota bacterium]
MFRSSLLLCAAAWLLALMIASPASPRPAPAARAQGHASLAGQFLVATEQLGDPRFARTVVYLVRHDATGAQGLVVNRPMREVPLAELLRHLGVDDTGVTGNIRLHYGGPVEPASGWLLHTSEYATEGTERVAPDIALTPLSPRSAVLGEIGRGGGPRRYLFALGYAGWAPGQLEGEIDGGAWITVSADAALLFDDDYARKWERAMARRRLLI